MRRLLVLLLLMLLLASNSILVAAEPSYVDQSQSLDDADLNITEVPLGLYAGNSITTASGISYEWDLNAVLIKEQSYESDETVLLKIEAERYIASRNETVTSPTIAINKEVLLKTNLLEAIAGKGTTNVKIDDWKITEDMLDENNTYVKEIRIHLNNKGLLDLTINVSIIGDNNIVLCSETETVTVENKSLLFVNGFWLNSDMDDFCIGRRAEPIGFWLQEALPDICVQIIKLDESGALGEFVYEIDNNNLRIGFGGKRTKSGKVNLVGEYYTIHLKSKNIPFLESGRTYSLVIMSGDKTLSFDGETPAILKLAVSDDGLLMRRNIKMELQRCEVDRTPKYEREVQK